VSWAFGETVVNRQLCGDRCWLEVPARVVSDTPGLLVTYLPGGARFAYVPGEWPTPNGRHPWHPRTGWSGHGVLMLHRPGDPYGVWHFWDGPDRTFSCWYLNIQDWGRDEGGFWIRDLELDVIVRPDGRCELKDEHLLAERVAQGRMSDADVTHAHRVAAEAVDAVRSGTQWWDPSWSAWTPPPGWDAP
jgi:hypothetical protein